MLLLWCLSMIQVFSYPLGERIFLLFVDLKQAIVFVSGKKFHLMFWDVSISPRGSYPFVVGFFSNNSVITFLEGCFPNSIAVEVGFFFSILLFQWSIFYSFFRRQCVGNFFEYPLILSRSCSIPSIYSRSAAQIISFLFLLYLVLTRVLRLSFLF